VRYLQPGFLAMNGYAKGSLLPENRVTVDPKRPDAYGIPFPVIRFKFCENDAVIWKDMKEKAKEILAMAKVRLLVDSDSAPTGVASHEVGTVRMGNDPRTSVLNAPCQAREVPNFLSLTEALYDISEKKPTVTIMALAVRTACYMTQEVKKGSLYANSPARISMRTSNHLLPARVFLGV
jgi:choline dehydrogenase-like flavoprotein